MAGVGACAFHLASLPTLGSHRQLPVFGGTSGAKASVSWSLCSCDKAHPPKCGNAAAPRPGICSQAGSIPPQQEVQESPHFVLASTPSSHGTEVLWVPMGVVPTVVVGFGCSTLWICWSLIRGGAFSQVGAHKQPLSPILPSLFCNQPAGWDLAGLVGDKQGSNPCGSPRKRRNSLQRSARHLAAACKLTACMQAGLCPPPGAHPALFYPPTGSCWPISTASPATGPSACWCLARE